MISLTSISDSEILSELETALNSQNLEKKKHFKKMSQVTRKARKTPQPEPVINLLDKIDSIFFDWWNVPKIPLRQGTLFLLCTVIISEAVFFLVLPYTLNVFLGITTYLFFSLLSFVFSHSLFHLITGELLGIKFKEYFIFKSSIYKSRVFPINKIANFIPLFGIKYHLSTFLKASKWKRTIMLISAPLLSWIWFGVNFLFLFQTYPIFETIMIALIISIGFLFSQVISFFFNGDLWKARLDY